jgi:hypothetical protein
MGVGLLLAAPAQAAEQGDIPAMLNAARAELGHSCPDLLVEFDTLDGAVGMAGSCEVILDRDWWTRASWRAACSALVHEYGHAIGLTFPDNPEDPAHSPDPSSVMYDHFGPLSHECRKADPTMRLLAQAVGLDHRQARRERRCERIENRRGTRRARRCWRVARRVERAAAKLWIQFETS